MLLLIAVIVTVLNAVKPLTMDDSAYFAYARQIAAHPLDPYGFQIFWAQWPEPANWLLAPPVIPYWWAIAIKFFGPSVLLWKLWLLPWIAAFVFAVHALLRRFSPAVAMPMTVFTAFAPVYLPAINYMLDVPALGLGLLALTVAMRAIDRRSIGLILLAGVMFGVSLQTKYTVATLPAVAALYGFSRQRFVFAVVPGLIAAAVFTAWELFVAHRYGQSHFLLHLKGPDLIDGKAPFYYLLWGLLTLPGGLLGPLALLMALAIGFTRQWLVIGVVSIVTAFAITAFGPIGLDTFTALGAVVCGIIATSILRLRWVGDDRYLLLWLLVELSAYLAMSPFGAARRMLGITIVLTLITGRLLERRMATPGFTASFRWLTRFGVATGLAFFAVDWIDANARSSAVESAAAVVQANRVPGETAYYIGHWGLQFYTERAGLLPILPDHTQLKVGDWILDGMATVNAPAVALPADSIAGMTTITVDDPLRLQTVPAYYGRLVPLDYRNNPRARVDVYRVTKPFVPATSLEAGYVLQWANTRKMPLMVDSIAAVCNAMRGASAGDKAVAMQAIRSSGPAAVAEFQRASQPAGQP